MELLKEKEYYDGFAVDWDQQFTTSLAGLNFRNRKLEFLNECLADQKGTCLDVGCATGHFTSRISNPNLDVVGVDMSHGMVKYASYKNPDNKFVVCPVQHLSSKFSGVDCIFLMGVLTKDSADLVVNECRDALRMGGKLVILSGNRRNFYLRFVYDLMYPDLPARTATLNRLTNLLAQHKFRVTNSRTFHLVPYVTPDFLFGALKTIECRIEKSFLASCMGTIVGVESIKV